MRLALSAAILVAASLPALALPIDNYPEYRATWSLNCKDSAADNVRVDIKSVTVTHKGTPHVFEGIEVSHTWAGGAPGSNPEGYAWLLISDKPGGDIKAVTQMPGRKKKGKMMLDTAYSDATALKPLDGKYFSKCSPN